MSSKQAAKQDARLLAKMREAVCAFQFKKALSKFLSKVSADSALSLAYEAYALAQSSSPFDSRINECLTKIEESTAELSAIDLNCFKDVVLFATLVFKQRLEDQRSRRFLESVEKVRPGVEDVAVRSLEAVVRCEDWPSLQTWALRLQKAAGETSTKYYALAASAVVLGVESAALDGGVSSQSDFSKKLKLADMLLTKLSANEAEKPWTQELDLMIKMRVGDFEGALRIVEKFITSKSVMRVPARGRPIERTGVHDEFLSRLLREDVASMLGRDMEIADVQASDAGFVERAVYRCGDVDRLSSVLKSECRDVRVECLGKLLMCMRSKNEKEFVDALAGAVRSLPASSGFSLVREFVDVCDASVEGVFELPVNAKPYLDEFLPLSAARRHEISVGPRWKKVPKVSAKEGERFLSLLLNESPLTDLTRRVLYRLNADFDASGDDVELRAVKLVCDPDATESELRDVLRELEFVDTFQAKLLSIEIQASRLFACEPALRAHESLAVKSVQSDSLWFVLLPHLDCCAFYKAAEKMCDSTIADNTLARADSKESLWKSIELMNHRTCVEIVRLNRRLRDSYTAARASAGARAHAIRRLAFGELDTKFVETHDGLGFSKLAKSDPNELLDNSQHDALDSFKTNSGVHESLWFSCVSRGSESFDVARRASNAWLRIVVWADQKLAKEGEIDLESTRELFSEVLPSEIVSEIEWEFEAWLRLLLVLVEASRFSKSDERIEEFIDETFESHHWSVRETNGSYDSLRRVSKAVVCGVPWCLLAASRLSSEKVYARVLKLIAKLRRVVSEVEFRGPDDDEIKASRTTSRLYLVEALSRCC